MKIHAMITLKSPCHTGASEKTGNTALFNKNKVLLKEPKILKSRFPSEDDRDRAFEIFSFIMYKSVPAEFKTYQNGFFYEKLFYNFETALSGTSTKKQFLAKLMDSCSVNTFRYDARKVIMEILDYFELEEFSALIRSTGSYFRAVLADSIRIFNEEHAAAKELTDTFDEGEDKKDFADEVKEAFSYYTYFQKDLESLKAEAVNPPAITIKETLVPEISGNGFKGLLRSMLAEDYVNRIGGQEVSFTFSDEERNLFDVNTFLKIFSGGNITDKGNTMSLSAREDFFRVCPPGRLGYAEGNQTVESVVKTAFGKVRCRENGTGQLSAHDLLTGDFYKIRRDTSKTQQKNYLINNKVGKGPQQMIAFIEVLKTGAVIDTSFTLTANDPITESMFFAGLKLLAEKSNIGGMGNIGLGEADWTFSRNGEQFEITDAMIAPYYDYLDSIAEKALSELTVRAQITDFNGKR